MIFARAVRGIGERLCLGTWEPCQWLAPFEKNGSPSLEAFNGLAIPMEQRDLRKLSALIY